MKKHLKRLAIPKSWPINRRDFVYITRLNPGPHPFKLSLPLRLVLKDILGIGKNAKEITKILHEGNVLVDGSVRKDPKFPVGVMDVVGIKSGDKYFRVVLNKGKIGVVPIEKKEAGFKPCKIIGKNKVKGKTQLNLYDGRNILVEKDGYKTGDTLIVGLPKQEVKEHIKLEKGCYIYLIGGKHSGDVGKVDGIISNKITYKSEKGDIIQTLKKYVFVVGKDKVIISLKQKE